MKLGDLEIRATKGRNSANALGVLACVWFIAGLLGFLAAGIDDGGHEHRFEHGCWITLVVWLGPYVLAAIGYALTQTVTVQRVGPVERLARLKAETEELERQAGL